MLSGRCGEARGYPDHACRGLGKLKELGVFGNDYDTPDGTGVRDYIHVVDLAKGHVKALQKIDEKCGLKVYNLGTGKGYSVLDMCILRHI